MRRIVLATALFVGSLAALTAQGDLQPTCTMCPATYIKSDEIQAYVQKAIAEKLVDQQIRDVEIGKSHVGIGVVYRGRLSAPAPDFTLKASDGQTYSLSKLRGKTVVLAWFPKAFTAG